MPTVEKINIDIGVNLPLLDRDMRAMEKRVDQGCRAMERSIARVSARMAGVGAAGGVVGGLRGAGGSAGGGMMGGSLANRVTMFPTRALGAMVGLGALAGAARGYAEAIRQGDESWGNIAFNMAKQMPILSSLVDLAEAYGQKLEGVVGVAEKIETHNKNIKDFDSFIRNQGPLARIEAEPDPARRAQLELDEALRQIKVKFDEMTAALPIRGPGGGPRQSDVDALNTWFSDAVAGAMLDFNKTIEAQEKKNKPKEFRPSFDTGNTVFGSFKMARVMGTDESKTRSDEDLELQTKMLNEAVQQSKKLDDLLRGITDLGNNWGFS